MNVYGYVRVSTEEQNEDRLMIAMREQQCRSGARLRHAGAHVPVSGGTI